MIPNKRSTDPNYNGISVKCDSSTFSKTTGRVRWITPRNITEWIFGRKTTFWRCVKCREEFVNKPDGQCSADITARRC